MIILFVALFLALALLIYFYISRNYISYEKFPEKKRLEAMNGIYNKPYVLYEHHKRLFDLLKKFIAFCEQNDIFYSICCGALIGLVRHNSSFIPWDDDLDICILDSDAHYFTDYYKSDSEVIKYTENTKYKNDNLPFLDLFILDNNTMQYKSAKARKAWPQDQYHDILPLKQTEFLLYNKEGKVEDSILVNVPNDINQWIKRSYGDDVLTTFFTHEPHCNGCFVTPILF